MHTVDCTAYNVDAAKKPTIRYDTTAVPLATVGRLLDVRGARGWPREIRGPYVACVLVPRDFLRSLTAAADVKSCK